jgi:hypothetical protein
LDQHEAGIEAYPEFAKTSFRWNIFLDKNNIFFRYNL